MKLHVQHIWPSPQNDRFIGAKMAILYDAQTAMIQSIAGPGVELNVAFNERSAYYTSCASMEAYNVTGILDALAAGEAAGCDAALIACGNDPGLHAARDALRIPVVSATESALLTACMLGRRFGVITADEASVALVERNLESYRLEDRAIRNRPVRSPGFYEDGTDWVGDPEYLRARVIPRFEEVARGMIEDGADVICTACGMYSAFSMHGYAKIGGTEVPVVEAIAAGTHMALMLARLRRDYGVSTSKQRAYRGIAPELAAQLLAPLRNPGTA
ncbi:MAG: hypothetical protein CALGDGBN_01511 [Pseudomonadales bacterium]|nr:hypothetical protein [Pseudomonadales bacterium]